MNLKAGIPASNMGRRQADIDRVMSIWKGCFIAYGGPYLFGAKPVVADAMYAPVCTRSTRMT